MPHRGTLAHEVLVMHILNASYAYYEVGTWMCEFWDVVVELGA